MRVGAAEIGVDQQDTVPLRRERQRQVRREQGLAYSTFTTADGDDSWGAFAAFGHPARIGEPPP